MRDNKKIEEEFFESLKEYTTNTMSDGNIKFFWRPNNYRLKIGFKGTSKITPHTKATFPVEIKISNYGSKITAKNFDGITLMRDKDSITCIYSLKAIIGKKAWYLVEAETLDLVRERIDMKVKEIESMCIDRAKRFVKHFGGRLILNDRDWIRHEDGIHGEDFIDQIDPELIIHDTYFKKVYNDHIEFKSPVFMKNYISNRAIENIAPDIALELKALSLSTEKLVESVSVIAKSQELFRENITSHLALIQEYRKEVIQRQKPFFVRWFEYFFRGD